MLSSGPILQCILRTQKNIWKKFWNQSHSSHHAIKHRSQPFSHSFHPHLQTPTETNLHFYPFLSPSILLSTHQSSPPSGCDINARDEIGYTALHLSAEHGYTDMMEVLLKNGAQVNFNIPPEFDDDFPTDAGDEPLRLALKVRKDDSNSPFFCSFLLT